MDPVVKKKVRDSVREVIKKSLPPQVAKQCLLDEIVTMDRNLESYIDEKIAKYCSQEVCYKVQNHLCNGNVSVDDISLLLLDIREPFKLFNNPCKILADCEATSIIFGLATMFNGEGKSYICSVLQSTLQPLLIKIGDTLAKGLTSTANEEFMSALMDYIQDFKTQFLTTSQMSPSELISGKFSETEDSDWAAFVLPNRKHAQTLAAKHEELLKRLQAKQFSNASKDQIQTWSTAVIKCIREVRTETVQENNVPILKVDKPIMVLSKVLVAVESELERNEGIAEVRFFAEKVFFVDVSLNSSVWRGKNILVVSECINCVVEDLHWDVSGNNATPVEENRANDAVLQGQDGCHGENGNEGESGGNIAIIANTFLNISNLSIHTNGGNGGDGQPGGNAKDGEDGKEGRSVSIEKLKTQFPSPVNATSNDEHNIEKTITYFREYSKFSVSCDGFLENGTKVGNRLFPKRYIYYKGVLEEHVRYEFCFSQWKRGRAAYLLFQGEKGSDGGAGGTGGMGGKGGKAGYAGTVDIFMFNKDRYNDKSPKIYNSNGKAGADGNNGSDGKPGKNGDDGKDVGYTDSYLWRNPMYFGPGSLQLVSESISGSVWCSKNQHYRCIKSVNREKRLERTTTVLKSERIGNIAVKKSAIDVNRAFLMCKSLSGTKYYNFGSIDINQQLSTWNLAKKSTEGFSQTNKTRRIDIMLHHQSPELSFSCIRDSNLDEYPGKIERYRNSQNLISSTVLSKDNHIRITKLMKTFKELDPWKISLFKTPDDSDSFIHAVFGTRTDPNFYSLPNSEPAQERRLKIVENLYETLINRSDKFPQSNEMFLPLLIQTLEKLFAQSQKATKEDDLSLWDKRSADSVLDLDNDKKFRPTKEACAVLKKALSHQDRSLQPHEYQMLAAFCDIRVEIVELEGDKLQNDTVCFNTFPQGTIIVALDNRGQYYRYEQIYVRCWSSFQAAVRDYSSMIKTADNKVLLPEILVNSIPAHKLRRYEDFIKGQENFSLKLFGDLSFIICGMDNRNWNLMLDEILFAIWTGSCCMHVFYIMITFSPSQWAKELCLYLLETYSEDCVFSKDHVLECAEKYRTTLARFPSNIVYHLVSLVRHNSRRYKNEFSRNRFYKDLQNFLKHSPFDEIYEYNELSCAVTASLWQPLLRKVKLMSCMRMLTSKINWQETSSNFNELFYYYYSIQEKYPNIDTFLNMLNTNSWGKSDRHLTLRMLSHFHSGRWVMDEETIDVLKFSDTSADFITKMNTRVTDQTRRTVDNLLHILKNDKINTFNIHQLENILNLSWLSLENVPEEKLWISYFKQKIQVAKRDSNFDANPLYIEALTKIEKAINEEFSHTLHETQKISILASVIAIDPIRFSSTTTKNTNLLLQVKTGEGKSYIVLACAILRGLFDLKTDVVTSSSVLARRDANKFENVFNMFGLSVGHITMDDTDHRTEEYKKMVVYGEASQFQRDYLIDHFYTRNVRGNRKFESIVIDEVDSMFLDKGNNVLYLSHSPAELEFLESVIFGIWQSTITMLNNENYAPLKIFEDNLSVIDPFRKVNPTKNTTDDNNTKLECLPEQGSGTVRDSACSSLTTKYSQLKSEGQNFSTRIARFIETHLLAWIKSAYQATQMQEGVEYVLSSERFHSQNEKYEKIVIVDLDTGNDLKDSQWSNGLHQFLQLKHGCRLSPISLKSVFISNITFFKRYASIFGLTGTLGSEQDRNFLTNTYQSKLLVVPTAYPSKFIEEEPIACPKIEDWEKNIMEDVAKKLAENRSVLIICEHIRDANKVYQYLRSKITAHQLILYRRDTEVCDVVTSSKQLTTKTVLVSTNLAGRGTDIKLSNSLRDSGGIHVIFSYLPSNSRVRWQGMGRAARCGDPGSGRMIFCTHSQYENFSSYMAIDFITKKDADEVKRVSRLHDHYENILRFEEEKFASFKNQFDEVNRCLDQGKKYFIQFRKNNTKDDLENLLHSESNDMKSLVTNSMLDDWAFWLDEYSSLLVAKSRKRNSATESELLVSGEQALTADFNNFCQRYKQFTDLFKETDNRSICATKVQDLADSIISGPCLTAKLAMGYLTSGNIMKASELFVKIEGSSITKSLPNIASKYYMILCQLSANKNPYYNIPVVSRLLSNFISQQVTMSRSIMANEYINEEKITITGGFAAQKSACARIIATHISSLEAIGGKSDTQPHDFLDLTRGDMAMAEMLFEALLYKRVLLKYQIKVENQAGKLISTTLAEDFEKQTFNLVNQEVQDQEVSNKNVVKQMTHDTQVFSHKLTGFLQEIKESVVCEADFIFIPKKNYNKTKSLNNELNLYLQEAMKQCTDDIHVVITTTNLSTSDFDGSVFNWDNLKNDSVYSILLHKKIAWVEKVAKINVEHFKTLQFTTHQKIASADLETLNGVGSENAASLYKELISTGILNQNGILKTADIDMTYRKREDFANTIYACLSEYTRMKLIALVETKCFYQLEKNRIIELTKSKNCQAIQLDRRFQSDTLDNAFNSIIAGIRVNPNFQLDSVISFIGISSNTGSLKKTENDLSTLASISALKSKAARVEARNLLILKGVIDESNRLFDEIGRLKRPQLLSLDEDDSLEYLVYEIIETFWKLQKQMECMEFRKKLEHLLKTWMGIITPEGKKEDCFFKATKLSSTEIPDLMKCAELSEEQKRLGQIGLEHVITIEKHYTNTMIISTTSILIIGTAQVMAGCVLGPVLISSGVHDLIFGLKAIHRGRFSWKNWALQKGINIATTVATAGFAEYGEIFTAVRTSSFAGTAVDAMKVDIVSFLYTEVISKLVATNLQEIVKKITDSLTDQLMQDIGDRVTKNESYHRTLSTVLERLEKREAVLKFHECSKISICLLSQGSEILNLVSKAANLVIDKGISELCKKLTKEESNSIQSDMVTLIPGVSSHVLSLVEVSHKTNQILKNVDAYIDNLDRLLNLEIDKLLEPKFSSCNDDIEELKQSTCFVIRTVIKETLEEKVNTDLLQRGFNQISRLSLMKQRQIMQTVRTSSPSSIIERRQNNLRILHEAEILIHERRKLFHGQNFH